MWGSLKSANPYRLWSLAGPNFQFQKRASKGRPDQSPVCCGRNSRGGSPCQRKKTRQNLFGLASLRLLCCSQPPGTVLVRSDFITDDTLMVGRKSFPIREAFASGGWLSRPDSPLRLAVRHSCPVLRPRRRCFANDRPSRPPLLSCSPRLLSSVLWFRLSTSPPFGCLDLRF
jgi:hypothetical protein